MAQALQRSLQYERRLAALGGSRRKKHKKEEKEASPPPAETPAVSTFIGPKSSTTPVNRSARGSKLSQGVLNQSTVSETNIENDSSKRNSSSKSGVKADEGPGSKVQKPASHRSSSADPKASKTSSLTSIRSSENGSSQTSLQRGSRK